LLKIPLSIACFIVGISFKSRFVSILSFIQIGLTPIKNSEKNIKKANKKFIKIPAKITMICFHVGFLERL
jgi:hypothetical protein